MDESALSVQLAEGSHAAVSSGHALATAEALRILRDGGNIVDAAVGGAMVMAVVLPYACGIGGDMYLLYHDAARGVTFGLNGTGAAPSLAIAARFPEGMPQTGVRSATVPGVVRAWDDALARFGTRSMRDLLQPAIAYAQDGFPAHEGALQNAAEKQRLLSLNAEAARLYLPGGRPHALGAPIVQVDLARSLRAVAEGGAAEFYEGAVARQFVAGTEALDGLFELDDLRSHRSLWQDPVHAPFYGHDVLTMPPNSLGASLLLQLLALQEDHVDALDPCSGALLVATIRAWRSASALSDDAMGDPRDAERHIQAILGAATRDPSSIAAVRASSTGVPASGDTSNLVIMDERGNAVSLVQSVSAPFSSGVVLPGTGILLNNRMRGFDTRSGGFNCVAPGRRPAHTLVPVLVARAGRIAMAIGTPGAAGQTITLAQVLTRILGCGESVAAAIAAPRWSIAPSGAIIVEESAAPAVIADLRELEPQLELAPMRHVRFGSIKAVWKDGSAINGAADFRRVATAGAF